MLRSRYDCGWRTRLPLSMRVGGADTITVGGDRARITCADPPRTVHLILPCRERLAGATDRRNGGAVDRCRPAADASPSWARCSYGGAVETRKD